MDADGEKIFGLLFGAVKGKVLFAANSLGVFDTLGKTGPLPAAELAARLPKPITAPLGNFERLLNACCTVNVLKKENGVFALTEISEKHFQVDAKASWSGVLVEHDLREYKLFGSLEHCARTGNSCWSKVFGAGNDEMFDNTYNDREGTKRFMHQMHSICSMEAAGVIGAYDLSKYPVICDVGGCSGTLAVKACEMYPNVNAIVLDLPSVVDIASKDFCGPPYINSEDVKKRVSWMPGDFFAEPEKLPDADLVILSHILHDWEDSRAIAVLEAVYKALHPGAALLISDAILNEDCGPFLGNLKDLIMIVRGPGRERTFREFKTMLENIGFRDIEYKGPWASTHAILCVKPKN